MAVVKGITVVMALAFISCIFAISEGQDVPDRNVATPWCVANPKMPDWNHKRDIDALCGARGVDCSQIKPGGPCFQPDNVKFHASVIFNQYYQARGDQNACNFGGDAMFTFVDPSTASCKFLKGSSA